MSDPKLVRFALHGGAGVIGRAALDFEREKQLRHALARITLAAVVQLNGGARALDVVESAICALEDFPLFNAGHGAVLNADGVAELDASIMEGRTRACGAVGAARTPKNPISLARAVMQQTEHVLLVGQGADQFASTCGVSQVAPEYFRTPERVEQQLKAAQFGRVTLDHDALYDTPSPVDKRGTVGAVGRDAYGDLAAGTSTGGMTNKLPGRCGDTPIIGAGTWADNRTCAASATGHGEFFVRCVVCYDLHARMSYAGATLPQAAKEVLERVSQMGGTGGLIAIDAAGLVHLPYNSEGMYRGWYDGSQTRIAIFAEESIL